MMGNMIGKYAFIVIKQFHRQFRSCNHSHKKQKDSLATRAKRAVLRAYVENQAILEPILLYRASNYKQTKRPSY